MPPAISRFREMSSSRHIDEKPRDLRAPAPRRGNTTGGLVRSHDCRALEIDIGRGVDPEQADMRQFRQSRATEKFESTFGPRRLRRLLAGPREIRHADLIGGDAPPDGKTQDNTT